MFGVFFTSLRACDYAELMNCDKANLDIFWLRDETPEESDNLPDPDVLARENVEDLEVAVGIKSNFEEGNHRFP